jgi:hypothetical protein
MLGAMSRPPNDAATIQLVSPGHQGIAMEENKEHTESLSSTVVMVHVFFQVNGLELT